VKFVKHVKKALRRSPFTTFTFFTVREVWNGY